MTDLARRFARHLAGLRLEPRPVLVAVSGGPDSLALLHLLREADEGLDLIVAHVDHGIHPESAAVAQAVRQAATTLGLPFELTTLKLGANATETVAREARYRWLKALSRKLHAWLFTAHHRDDQVETVLMRVLKGSGPAGLAGIAPVSGMLVRPLLPFGRAEIHDWLAEQGIEAWDDPANRDSRHLRSWLRTELLPAARIHVPGLDHKLIGLAEQSATDRAAWDAVVELLGVESEREGEGFRFDARPLRGKPEPLIEALFVAIARKHGGVFGGRAARRVAELVRSGQSGRRVDLKNGWEAWLQFGRVSVRMAPLIAPADLPELTIDGDSGRAEWDGWEVSWSPDRPPEQQARVTETAWLSPARYTVRAWRQGDRIRPLGGSGSRLVVRCMQDAKVPAAERQLWPVVGDDQGLVWVPQVCRSSLALARAEALRVTFSRRSRSK